MQPYQRFWELYLGSRLLDLGFELQPRSSDEGPDFHIIVGNENVWIEATAPSEGVGVDAVPTLIKHSRFDPIPEEKMILRFTNAISEKRGKLIQYQQNGIVQPDDAFLVGICGGMIQLILLDAAPIPTIIKSVYPIGEHKLIIDTKKLEIVEERYEPRYEVLKASDSPVSTRAFIDPLYSGISGIIYSNTAMTNLPADPNKEFLFIHNYLASVPLGRGWLKTGEECFIEEDRLIFNKIWQCA